MSDILVRDMKMPRSCMDCRLNYGEKRPEHGLTIVCKYSNGVVLPEVVGVVGRLPTCGLLELQPHGDLIDKDEILSDAAEVCEGCGDYAVFGYSHEQIENATVIIPASK